MTITEQKTRESITDPGLDRGLARWKEARAETDGLFKIVRPEFLYDRPIAERHRLVFYIGHLEAFDWNLLRGPLRIPSFAPDLDQLFAFGIDPVEGNLPTDQPADWPSLARVYEYRDRIRQALDRAFESADLQRGGAQFDELLNVAVEHRLMHAETLAYLFHQMPLEKKSLPALEAPSSRDREVISSAIRIPDGSAMLGLAPDSKTFGWDNEFDAHIVDVPEFLIDRYKVTNGQFLQFLESGGYDDRELWAEEDWNWLRAESISHPAFWIDRADGWKWRSMFAEIPLPADGPVYVSHAEASAYAKWLGAALPTEAQWQHAAYGTNESAQEPELSPHPEDRRWDPSPVDDPALQSSGFGVYGMISNGWEWTSTTFAPFEGFRSRDFYPGYSAPFFDGKHFVLKGGSVRTAPCMLRPSFRNWFQPRYQYVYAGFRCVRPKG